MTVEVLDLFSAAAGGWSLGMHRAGYSTMAACEVEAWRRAIYSENNPDVKVYDDVRTLTAERLLADLGRLPAIVVGSPPCQDISSANTKGKGVDGERSGLYFEAIRIIGECRPRWFALENSANLRTRGADAVSAALEAIGYTCWPVVVRAGDIGANHDRARAWLIGCDLGQVADPDGFGRDEGRGRGRGGIDVSFPGDSSHSDDESELCSPLDAEVGIVQGLGADRGRDAADALGARYEGRPSLRPGWEARNQYAGSHVAACSGSLAGTGNASDADQARQAHGCMEPGVRQAEISDDGRGAGRCDDGSCAGQVELCAADRGNAVGGRSGWRLADFADHLRLDDGLSTRLAGTRVAVGGPKGTSAASLVVEAFGDAVVPQIPEAIGRAIQRVEMAMAALHGKAAA